MAAPWDPLVIEPERTAWADELRSRHDLRTTKLAIVCGYVCLFKRRINPDGSLGGFVCQQLSSVDEYAYLSRDVVVGPFVTLIGGIFKGAITIGGDPARTPLIYEDYAVYGRMVLQGENGRRVASARQSYHNHDPIPYLMA